MPIKKKEFALKNVIHLQNLTILSFFTIITKQGLKQLISQKKNNLILSRKFGKENIEKIKRTRVEIIKKN